MLLSLAGRYVAKMIVADSDALMLFNLSENYYQWNYWFHIQELILTTDVWAGGRVLFIVPPSVCVKITNDTCIKCCCSRYNSLIIYSYYLYSSSIVWLLRISSFLYVEITRNLSYII